MQSMWSDAVGEMLNLTQVSKYVVTQSPSVGNGASFNFPERFPFFNVMVCKGYLISKFVRVLRSHGLKVPFSAIIASAALSPYACTPDLTPVWLNKKLGAAR
jgi:hypothetical protein